MRTITIVANSNTREVIRLVLRWYRTVEGSKFIFNVHLIKLFLHSSDHISLTNEQAVYLIAALQRYETALKHKLTNLHNSMKENSFTLIISSYIPLQFTISSVQDVLRQLDQQD